MAGGYGAFGPLEKGDKSEEKYYVTMRWGYADWIEPESELGGDLSKSATSLTLDDADDFAKSGYVKIGSEYVRYSSKSKNKLKGLKRGYKSSKSSHDKNDNARQMYRYKGGQWERVTRALHATIPKEKTGSKREKVLVTNERNGKRVVASILESGPAIWTNRVGGLSPEAFEAIDARNNENCTFQYVDEDTKLGESRIIILCNIRYKIENIKNKNKKLKILFYFFFFFLISSFLFLISPCQNYHLKIKLQKKQVATNIPTIYPRSSWSNAEYDKRTKKIWPAEITNDPEVDHCPSHGDEL